MAISKAKLREMRENSAAGAAKQRAKEQAELDKYMYRRNTEVAQMMSAKERDAAVIKAAGEGVPVMSIAARFGLTEDRVLKINGKTAGVVDAAELSSEERKKLTAEVEAAAGIVPENEPEEPAGTDVSGIAAGIMAAVRKAVKVPREVEVKLTVTDGFYELEVTDAFDENITATFTWR